MVRYLKQYGVRVKNNRFMLDFMHQDRRYRPLTIYEANKINRSKVEKLLNSIKIDLERGQFLLANYSQSLVNPNYLAHLDVNFVQNQDKINTVYLIDEQLEVYRKRFEAGTLSVATYEGYKYAINLHLKPFFDEVAIGSIDYLMLEQLIDKLPFSRKRIGLILRPLKLVIKRALKANYITINPFDKLDNEYLLTVSVTSDYEVNPFSQEEIILILDNCEHLTVRNYIQTGFWSGMRISEMFALEWSDIDFELETIRVNKSQTRNRLIKDPKTPAGNRIIEMTPKAKEALLSQFEITGKDQDQRVFKTPRNKIWAKPDNLGRYWRVALEKAGVVYRNPYQMRHTFISYMLSLGNSPLILYRMVGHENSELLYKKYARFIKSTSGKLLKTE